MDVAEFLKHVEDLEQRTANLYEYFSQRLVGDEGAAEFFYKLHLQEIGHRNLVRFARRMIEQNPTLCRGIELDPGRYSFLPAELDDCFKEGGAEDLSKMLNQAQKIEESLSESTMLGNLPDVVPHLSTLLDRLIKDSQNHHLAVKCFADSRHVRLTEAG